MFRGLCMIPLLGCLLIVTPVDARADAMVTVLQKISALRREHGLSPVRIEPLLTVEARAHAWDMARHDYFDTRTPDGKKFETGLERAEYPFRRMFVQLAVGHPTPIGVLAGWMSKEDTRRQLLDARFVDIGLGYAAKQGVSAGRAASNLDHFWGLTLAEPSIAFRGDWRAEILERVNAFGSGRGLVPLKVDLKLNTAAQRHADDMAQRDYFAHVAPEGGTVGQRASQAGYLGGDWCWRTSRRGKRRRKRRSRVGRGRPDTAKRCSILTSANSAYVTSTYRATTVASKPSTSGRCRWAGVNRLLPPASSAPRRSRLCRPAKRARASVSSRGPVRSPCRGLGCRRPNSG